jgi:hypothetical protein
MPAKNPASKNRKPSRLDAKPAVKKKGAKSSSVIPPKKLSALAAAAQDQRRKIQQNGCQLVRANPSLARCAFVAQAVATQTKHLALAVADGDASTCIQWGKALVVARRCRRIPVRNTNAPMRCNTGHFVNSESLSKWADVKFLLS